MEDEIKVSQLAEASAANDADLLMIIQGGVNKKVQVSKIRPLDFEVCEEWEDE